MSSKLYWNTPRVQNVNANNVYKIYNDFVIEVIGEDEKNLSDRCIDICEKNSNPRYYGHIITLINLLGLLQYKKENEKYIVEENKFLFENMDNDKFVSKYLDYSLTYFQYPRHNINEDRSLEIRKPYLVILTLLKKLSEKNPKEAYITKNELYYLFNKNEIPYKSYQDIDTDLVELILKDKRAWGREQDDVDTQLISYDMALFKNSSILTFDSADYGDVDNFAFGLSNEYNIDVKLKWLLCDEVKNDIFEFDKNVTATDKDVITKWAKFLNNEERFQKWENQVFYEEEKEELGESGIESGIESDNIESDDFITPFNPDEISISSKTVSLDSVLRRIKNKTIRLTPPFQRKSVWDDLRKSRLIESMMLNIPLPMFYISSDVDGNWDVVDGLQRITTIKEFILGQYQADTEKYNEKGFKLKKLEFWGSLDGKRYDELPGKLYNNIADTELQFTIINPDTPEEVKRNIFKRINTGGMPLTSQEIRHALYQGESTKLLEKLSENKEFLLAVTRVDDSRMGARELILRFLSFYIRDYTQYQKDSGMDAHLSNSMRIINHINNLSLDAIKSEFKYDKGIDSNDLYSNIKQVTLEQIEEDFKIAMMRARKIFREHTFRKSYPGKRRTPINKTLFEVFGNLLVNLSENEFDNLVKNKKEFLEEYKEKYLLTTEFAHMIGRDSHRVSSVRKRYEELSSLIKKHIKEV